MNLTLPLEVKQVTIQQGPPLSSLPANRPGRRYTNADCMLITGSAQNHSTGKDRRRGKEEDGGKERRVKKGGEEREKGGGIMRGREPGVVFLRSAAEGPRRRHNGRL